MKKPKSTSIIVPAYNEEDYIEACLDALLEQSLVADEIIVVNNNSTDKTEKLVRKYSQVKLMNESQQGQVFARKYGFNQAKGQLLFTIDADTVVSSGWLATMIASFNENNWDGLTGRVNSRSKLTNILVLPFYNFFLYTLNRWLLGHNILYGSNMGLTRQSWNKVKSKMRMTTEVWEDFDISLILAQNGGEIGLIKSYTAMVSTRVQERSPAQLWAYLGGWHRTLWPYHRFVAVAVYLLRFLVYILVLISKIPHHLSTRR